MSHLSQGVQQPVTAIVVTYNSSRHVDPCLTTFFDGTPDLSAVVIDNASQDDTLHRLEGFKNVRVVANANNVGFSKAVNQALALVPVDQPVLLLNPDARFAGRDVRRLLTQVSVRADWGLAAPLVRQTRDFMDVVHGGRAPTLWRMFTHQSGLSRLGARTRLFEGHYSRLNVVAKSPGAYEVDWVSGGCVLISPNARKYAPRLDDTWFMYAEDIEYCLRVRRHGLTVSICPSIEARHEVGGSRTRHTKASSEWILNLHHLYRRDISRGPASAFAWRVVVCAGLLSRAAGYRLRSIQPGRPSDERRHWKSSSTDFTTYAKDLAADR